jgi:hypothetical protein
LVKNICQECNAEIITGADYCTNCGALLPVINESAGSEVKRKVTSDATDKRAKVIAIVVGVILFICATYFKTQLFSYFKKESVDQTLSATAAEINKSCPVIIDDYTRLDNVFALHDNAVQFNYSLIQTYKSDIDINKMMNDMLPRIIEYIKTEPGMRYYTEHDSKLIYSYQDKNGVFIMEIIVTPEMYK